MTLSKFQRDIANAARSLDSAADFLYDRGFEREWAAIENALEYVSDVANGFLDDAALQRLPMVIDGTRPRPGEVKVVRKKAA